MVFTLRMRLAAARVAQAPVRRKAGTGLFSEALKIVRARAASAEEVKAQGGHLWEPSRSDSFVDMTRMPLSHHDLVLELPCEHLEHVDPFVLTDESRRKLFTRLCASRKINGRLMSLLVSGQAVRELVIPDCSTIREHDFCRVFQGIRTEWLQIVKLGMCGRVLSDQFVECVRQKQGFPVLRTLSLQGVFRMTEGRLIELVQSCKELTCLELREFDSDSLSDFGFKSVVETVGSRLESLSLEGCDQLNPEIELPLTFSKMPNLRRLTLSGIGRVTDKVIQVVVKCSGANMTELELGGCHCKLTDKAVSAIVSGCPGLKALNLDNLKLLTDASVEAMVNRRVRFEKLSLKHCKFSDEALACLVTSLEDKLKQLPIAWATVK